MGVGEGVLTREGRDIWEMVWYVGRLLRSSESKSIARDLAKECVDELGVDKRQAESKSSPGGGNHY